MRLGERLQNKMANSREEIRKRLLEHRIKFATVSGIFSTKPKIIEWMDIHVPELEVITTKSYQVRATEGNREPIIVEPEVGCFGNAVGLRNPGMEAAFAELTALKKRRSLSGVLNISFAASSVEDFVTLAEKFNSLADIIELNFSCPHARAGFGSSIGGDARTVAEYTSEIRKATDCLLFPKLTPNVDNIGEIALAAIEAGADGIVAINTVGPEVYVEPHTGKPVLYNPGGHKGGKSGEWITEVAIDKVREIRSAIGEDYPIIGMGGVTTGDDVRRMADAGANVVGVGSVLARMSMKDIPRFISALRQDAENGTDTAQKFVSQERLAKYVPYRINKIMEKEGNLRVFELEGTLKYEASEYAFLWVPDVGEKPFSIACPDPLTFVVRKRDYDAEEKKGLVTHALFQLQEGDELMVRGVYGSPAPKSKKSCACIVTGGTGIAVVPKLAEMLAAQGKTVRVYYGVTSEEQIVLKDEIRRYAEFIPVADNGVLGRVLDVLREDLSKTDIVDSCFYNVGPVPLMKRAMDIQAEAGASKDDIFSSLELNTLCGIGMCGECECGGVLTCKEGTFVSLSHLIEHEVDIMKYAH